MKKKILIALGIVIALLGIVFAGAGVMFGKIIRSANTIRKLEEGLYTLEFDGDYGFDAFLEQGGASSDAEVAAYLTEYLSHGLIHQDASSAASSGAQDRSFGCSTVYMKDVSGSIRFGRNYDWQECRAILVHTKPKKGYESISTSCLDFLGFGDQYEPDGSISERIMTLAAIYVPLDGMNEKGLMAADLMAGDDEVTHQDTDRADLTTTTAIRLILDQAATVDEAIALLSGYDMNSSIGSAHHLSIADASGKSVVVEYIDGEMCVSDAKIVTNHYLTGGKKYGIGSENSHIRYDTLKSMMDEEHEELPFSARVLEMLKKVAQFNYRGEDGSYEKTMWSIVYNPTELTQDFYFNEDYDSRYRLVLYDMKNWVRFSGEEGDWLDALSINEWNRMKEELAGSEVTNAGK